MSDEFGRLADAPFAWRGKVDSGGELTSRYNEVLDEFYEPRFREIEDRDGL